MSGPIWTADELELLLDVALVVLLVAFAFGITVEFCQAPYRDLDLDEQPPTVVHACPPQGSGLMPCCGRTPLEAPIEDRITEYGPLVTCGGAR